MSWNDFSDQSRVVGILQGSLRHQRLAHAYLFAGPRGSGKKRVALHLAKSLFCLENEYDACGHCLNCTRVEGGNHPDVYVLSPDGASLKIDQIRALQKEMGMKAHEEQSAHKVYILEHVDKMTVQAANSLLKFLEEPPRGVVALLLTEQPHAILPTILSRCQTLSFSPVPPESIAARLEEEGFPKGIARLSSHISADLGEARDLCQSEWFALLRNKVIQLTEDIKQRGSTALFTIHEWFLKQEPFKEELPVFLDLLTLWLRDILYAQAGRNNQILFVDHRDLLERQSLAWTQAELIRGIGLVMETRSRIERNANPQLALEQLVLLIQEG
jgi:DNA polymerase-3 subunit delta'